MRATLRVVWRMRLGQFEVLPLKRGLHSVEQAVIINQVLAELGSRPIIDAEGQWARISQPSTRATIVATLHTFLMRSLLW